MNIRLNVLLFCFCANSAFAIEVIEPQELQTSEFTISDPDKFIKTLGKVDFIIDLSASHDDLLALKVRRSSLKLKDGRSFKSFGVHKEGGIIVIAGGNVSHVSIASVQYSNASVLFYGKNNEIIAPKPSDIAMFDLNFRSLDYYYKPLKTPNSLTIPITIALDTSGSMDGQMDKVIKATKEFMNELPTFTRCQLITFSDDINYLSSRDIKKQMSCPASSYLLNKPLKAGGLTALYKAIDKGFDQSYYFKKGFPDITVVVTDGMNTVDYVYGISNLIDKKIIKNSKLFVFWAGNYDKSNLKALPDFEFVSTQNIQSDLEKFFKTLGVSLSGIQTLSFKRDAIK